MMFVTQMVVFVIFYAVFVGYIPSRYEGIKTMKFDITCLYGVISFLVASLLADLAVIAFFGGGV